jgi:hypothetical protein
MGLERSIEDRVGEVMYRSQVTKGVADRTIRDWFKKGIKAPDLLDRAVMTEMYLLHIPFWRFVAQGKAVACGYSEYSEKTGNTIRNIYKELINDEFVWTEVACDTGKYGITKLWLDPGNETPYTPGTIVAMEPEGSAVEASKRGREAIRQMIGDAAAKRIDTLTLEKSFLLPKVFELVYAPIWIAHYKYQGGDYTVILDAVRGEVLGGTAPMNLTARARMMILSMAASGIMIGSSLAMLLHEGRHSLSELFQVILLLLGIAMSMAAYPAFREGRTFESSGTMKNITSLQPAGRVPKKLTDEEILKRESTILLCPICGEKMEQPWGEVISICKKCHRLLNVTSDEVKVVPYDVAQPDVLAEATLKNEPEYIPFWKYDVVIRVTDELRGGETETGLPDISGERSYYICAADIPRYLAERWEIDLTIRNPGIVKLPLNEKIELKPVIINQNTATELSEFLFLRYEEEKPGILQVLRYDFEVKRSRIVYVPYYIENKTHIPGI